jgi:hypothetical protein
MKRFLIEIKLGKEVLYSVTLSTQTANTAKTWAEKWIEINHYKADNPRIVVTEVVK